MESVKVTKKSIQEILDEQKKLSKIHTTSEKSINQKIALTGRKMPETSKRMKENNPMQGKVSPNKGKSMPQISEKVKGKKKPEGFGLKVSEARKKLNLSNAWAGKERPEHSELMKDPTRNKGAQTMRDTLKCPHCGKVANIPNYKRWHGDNCKHI